MILTQKVGTQFVHVSTLLLTVAILTSRQINGLPSIETSLFTLTPQVLKEPSFSSVLLQPALHFSLSMQIFEDH